MRARFALSTHEAGGFSANGQPIDQVHHLLRARLELVDADDIACESDLHRRPPLLGPWLTLSSVFGNSDDDLRLVPQATMPSP